MSKVVMVDEEEEMEEIEENELEFCEGEMDTETPPWNFYGDEEIDCDDDIDDQEDTALLRASAAKTEIVITPMSPVSIDDRLYIDWKDKYANYLTTYHIHLFVCVCSM